MSPDHPATPPAAPNDAPAAPVTAPQTPLPALTQLALEQRDDAGVPELIIYSHSSLLYWWPVWVVGYVMTFITYFYGRPYNLDPGQAGPQMYVHPSGDLGVLFFVTLFVVILITNVTARGLVSVIVILCVLLTTVLLAYLGLWDRIFSWFDALRIYLNLGAYFWFSTLMLLTWGLSVFLFDHMSYWRIKPGQITHEYVLGAVSRSYDTRNMVLEKFRDDLFRHWVLGIGSGDLQIETMGAVRETIRIRNVLFVGSRIDEIQRLIALKPSEFGDVVVR